MTTPSVLSSGAFGVVSSRTVLSPANALVAIAAWCPLMDLLALVTHDSVLHIQRLNWQKIIALPLEDEPECKQVDFQEGICAATRLAWRPDGKALAIGFHGGVIAILSIETRTLVASWKAGAVEGSITALKWIEWPMQPPLSLQHQFLCQLSNAAARRNLAPSIRGDEAADLFGPLLPLDSIDETYAVLSTPVGALASVPTSSSGVSKARGNSTTSAAACASDAIRGVAHDAFANRLTLIVSGDSQGHVAARACGTLQVLDIDLNNGDSESADEPAHVLAIDMCVASGVVTAITRNIGTHSVRLQCLWASSLLTHHSELLYFAQHPSATSVPALLPPLLSPPPIYPLATSAEVFRQ